VASLLLALGAAVVATEPAVWRSDWPHTDFTHRTVDLAEILDGGPPRDGIPAIDHPRFVPLADARDLADREPVIGLVLNGDARAYPLRVLIWHEIVNDTVGGIPVAVTYCPLCNSAIAVGSAHGASTSARPASCATPIS
jgi:hypothetical protein